MTFKCWGTTPVALLVDFSLKVIDAGFMVSNFMK